MFRLITDKRLKERDQQNYEKGLTHGFLAGLDYHKSVQERRGFIAGQFSLGRGTLEQQLVQILKEKGV